MKSPSLLVSLLLLNLGFLAYNAVSAKSTNTDAPVPVLRCRALELVDDHGRVRAELKIFPAQPELRMPNGTVGYPETVLLRLVSAKGAPHVKVSASEDGAGMVLGGEGGYVQVLSRGAHPFLKLVDHAGREQLLKP